MGAVDYLFVAATSFALSLPYFIFGQNIALKIIPILFLAICAQPNSTKDTINNSYASKIQLGILFSCLGDIFLEIDDINKTETNFIFGLLSFLLAHIIYIYAFYNDIKTTGTNKSKLSWVIIAVFLFFIQTVLKYLLPNAPKELQIPIIIYASIIAIMAYCSTIRCFFLNGKGKILSRASAFIGSIVFVASDTILSFNKFHSPIQDAKFYVMVTYYIAQTLIGASAIDSAIPSKEKDN